ncbi:sigma-70 family RNA polymerase sigma factor [Nakamurella sp. DB0629]|uniref:Sigma-70 family RNA polymerase sigma factor n=2 Tax=Nakamurella aerolata TaxID=1656892 RepID=A0A849A5S3_9ACTN|nr:sigma-70 family RNA polymerase sigma factor [Nakamurella aerolata]NNG35875.1 sigma-70 family RNA polymerase sigma factor [Nakamurella aerolata]
MSADQRAVAQAWREHAGTVVGALIRRFGYSPSCEDAVSEAFAAASAQWPSGGHPDDPRAWLIRVAERRMIDLLRSERARDRRQATHAAAAGVAAGTPNAEPGAAGPADQRHGLAGLSADTDDTLELLLRCCADELSRTSQVALTLRVVAGLSTEQIAAAFAVPESTMAQRISRAKTQLRHTRDGAAPFALPEPTQLAGRLDSVRDVLHVIYQAGYLTDGARHRQPPQAQHVDLAGQAIDLARQLHLLTRRMPTEAAESAGLLALLLLTEARRAARLDPGGDLIDLEHQDRSRWNTEQITEGNRLLQAGLRSGPVGRFQLQAAIAACHDQAPTADATDWAQILTLYRMLYRLAPHGVVALNLAVAVAMTSGPEPALRLVDALESDGALRHSHRIAAVRGHLLERAGRPVEAKKAFLAAAAATRSVVEQRYLNAKAAAQIG